MEKDPYEVMARLSGRWRADGLSVPGFCCEHFLMGEIIYFFIQFKPKMEKAMAPTPALLPGKSHGWRSLVGCSPWGQEELDMTEQLHFHFHVVEKEMATHSSVLAWRIPGTEEPGGLPSMGWHRVGHD